MDSRGISKKTYKDIKKEVSLNTAMNVGYYSNVISDIHPRLLTETITELATNGWIKEDTEHEDIMNMLVTESVSKSTTNRNN